MRRIKLLTRPNVNAAYVRQGIILDILEKRLRSAVADLGNLGAKQQDQ